MKSCLFVQRCWRKGQSTTHANHFLFTFFLVSPYLLFIAFSTVSLIKFLFHVIHTYFLTFLISVNYLTLCFLQVKMFTQIHDIYIHKFFFESSYLRNAFKKKKTYFRTKYIFSKNLLWELLTKKIYSQSKSWDLYFIWQEFLGLLAWKAASSVTLSELFQGGNGGNQDI